MSATQKAIKTPKVLSSVRSLFSKPSEGALVYQSIKQVCEERPHQLPLFNITQQHNLVSRSPKLRFNLLCLHVWLSNYRISFSRAGVYRIFNLLKQNRDALLKDNHFVNFCNEYDPKVDRVLASTYRSLEMALDDHFMFDGVAFSFKKDNQVVQRPLEDIVYDHVFEEQVCEDEFIHSFSDLLTDQIVFADRLCQETTLPDTIEVEDLLKVLPETE